MGNYNADPNPDLSKITMIAYGFGFFTQDKTKADQFSTLTDLKVYKLCKKIGTNRLRVLVDPDEIPGL
jgi:hypothetical protein